MSALWAREPKPMKPEEPDVWMKRPWSAPPLTGAAKAGAEKAAAETSAAQNAAKFFLILMSVMSAKLGIGARRRLRDVADNMKTALRREPQRKRPPGGHLGLACFMLRQMIAFWAGHYTRKPF